MPKDERLTIMQVAVRLKMDYQNARKLMLEKSDVLETDYAKGTKTLTCSAAKLTAFLREQKESRKTPPKPAA